jgi:hypothetical protein
LSHHDECFVFSLKLMLFAAKITIGSCLVWSQTIDSRV